MTNTDSDPFLKISYRRSAFAKMSAVSRSAPAGIRNGISRRISSLRNTDKDFRLGLNAAQTTLSGMALLTGATNQEVV